MKTPPVIWYAKQPRNTAELSPFPQRKAGGGLWVTHGQLCVLQPLTRTGWEGPHPSEGVAESCRTGG